MVRFNARPTQTRPFTSNLTMGLSALLASAIVPSITPTSFGWLFPWDSNGGSKHNAARRQRFYARH